MLIHKEKKIKAIRATVLLGGKTSVLKDLGRIVMLQELKLVLFCRPV